MDNLLIIVDGNSLMNRAFYALPELMNKKGLHTNALYGFANILFKIIDTYQPSHMSIAFDLKAPTFRHLQYKEYKGKRKKMPEELAQQVEPMKQMVDAFGISRLEMQGYEADDIIGTVSKYSESQGYQVYIITGDKDALQLASDKVRVFLTKKGISELEEYGSGEMLLKYGITPQQFVDLKGLMGDKSDNIPGVAGIGEKTGIKLIQEYGSIEGIYQNLENIHGAVKKKLEAGYEDAILSKNLAKIVLDMPIELSMDELKLRKMDALKLTELFKEFEFGSLLGKVMTVEPTRPAEVSSIYRINRDNMHELFSSLDLNSPLFLKIFAREGRIEEKKIGFVFLKNDQKVFAVEEDCVEGLRALLEDETVLKYGCHMKEDCLYLRPYGISLENLAFDAAIAEYLIDATSSHYDLSDIAVKYSLGSLKSWEDFAGKGKHRRAWSEIPQEEVMSYFAFFLDVVQKASEVLLPKIHEDQMDRLFDEIEMPLVKVLADMEYEGIAVDRSILLALKEQFQRIIGDLESSIYEFAKREFNINSPKQLGEVLFEDLRLPVIKKTKTGYSTNAEVLEALYDQHPIIEKIALYRQYTKLQSTYVDGLLKIINPHTGRIHSSFNQTITTTGRISSTEPNMQNIPVRLEIGRELRKVFVSKGGSWLVDADYSQIELRVLAHISEDDNLIEAFSKEADIHTSTASEVFGVPVDEVSREQRSAAKAVNFGIVYGISDFGLSNNLGIDIKTAKRYIDSYFDRYPKIKTYMEAVVQQAQEKGYVTTVLGRRRYVPEVQSKNFVVRNLGKRLAMNTPIQGSAADIIKIAMVRVYQRLKREKLDSKLILQVHDELLVEAKEQEVEVVRLIVREEMEQAMQLRVKLLAEVESGKSWYETK